MTKRVDKIEPDLLAITRARSPKIEASMLEVATDEFRVGRDASQLLPLLDANDSELVFVAVYILGEISFEFYKSAEFLSRLRNLLDHEDPTVRFKALCALFPALDPHQPSTQQLLQRLHRDPNEGVQGCVEAAAEQLGLEL